MKLIDLLVQELPKRGGWPEGSTRCMQVDGKYVTFPDIGDHCDFVAKCMVDGVRIATREQYEAALAAAQQPVWNGEGLPPVGCECERSWCGDKWLKCKILFMSNETVVVKLATREVAYGRGEVKFRAIRSEADTKRDEVGLALYHAINWNAEGELASPKRMEDYKKAYDAIAAGKIPHIRIE